MMGQQAGAQDQLFYSFSLETHIPSDHILRSIDRFLHLGALRQHLSSFYSHTGRPSIDPELMIRMLIIGYCFGIRSERRLCQEVHLNLAYRWFCRLNLDDAVPEHSTFSKNRHGRFRASATFRWLFDEVVRSCMAAGLVKGEGFAVDASVVVADASRQRGVPSSQAVDWKDPLLSTRAVHEYLEPVGRGADEGRSDESGRRQVASRATERSEKQHCDTAGSEASGKPRRVGHHTRHSLNLLADQHTRGGLPSCQGSATAI